MQKLFTSRNKTVKTDLEEDREEDTGERFTFDFCLWLVKSLHCQDIPLPQLGTPGTVPDGPFIHSQDQGLYL